MEKISKIDNKNRKHADAIFIVLNGKKIFGQPNQSHKSLMTENSCNWNTIEGAGLIWGDKEEYYEIMEPNKGFVYYLRNNIKNIFK